ncbi:MAG: SURF1 family cytochrome oxidase biogenesis protein [Hellea sp.]|nr:SURF1 family cytochrome oxidase biogenesis protein [Hellea sp.]
MRRIHFNPMPWLTAIVLLFLFILIKLGTWQYERLKWKTNLLAEVESAAVSEPFYSLKEVQKAVSSGVPVDFRRVVLRNTSQFSDAHFFVFTSENRNISWRVFRPITESEITVFSSFETIKDVDKLGYINKTQGSDLPVVGYIRLAREVVQGAPRNTPSENRWFGFNQLPNSHPWDEIAGVNADMSFYIDAKSTDLDNEYLPPLRPDIRNNHLDYMLTWYSFAIILMIIYFIIHNRAGRLKFHNEN